MSSHPRVRSAIDRRKLLTVSVVFFLPQWFCHRLKERLLQQPGELERIVSNLPTALIAHLSTAEFVLLPLPRWIREILQGYFLVYTVVALHTVYRSAKPHGGRLGDRHRDSDQ